MGLLASLTGIRSGSTTTVTSKSVAKSSKYRGVQVIPNSADCCMAVQAAEGKRFLSENVPKLPLAGCDANKCHCTYELFHDRRTEPRRTSDVAFDMASQLCEQDNRDGDASGRRNDD